MWKQLKDVRKRRVHDSYLGKGHMTLCQVNIYMFIEKIYWEH